MNMHRWEKWWLKGQSLWGITAGFQTFPKYHQKILPWILNEKMGRKDIFKPTIGNESLPQDSNDNVARIVNFATSKNFVKSTMFQIRNTHTYTFISPNRKTSTWTSYGKTSRLITYWYEEAFKYSRRINDHSGEPAVIVIIIWWLQKLGKDWGEVNKSHRSYMCRDLVSKRYVRCGLGKSIRLRSQTGLRNWKM